MKTDNEVQQDVRDEIKWDARVTASDIGVSVKNGIVTLNGTARHYVEKTAAEEAAQRVAGVQAVANEIKVNFYNISLKRTDQEIAEAAMTALKWNYEVPDKDIMVSVSNGVVTLKGETEWAYQKQAAKNCVKSLNGVTDVLNKIEIKSHVQPSDIKTRIEAALRRSADTESKGIHVTVEGNRVTLSGSVHSLAEKEDARWAAYCAPGINRVENNLSVSSF